ncbi:MAG: hypothetical protein M3383_04620 [Actinomycetota bacterium]|nr:hypothetical protein [Actinomycetota bacterium]
MDPSTRAAILIGGLVFVLFFGGMTLVVLAQDGFNILIVPSLAIVALLGIAIWGAINSPPDDRR